MFEKHDYLMDPHTAVAYQTAQNLRGENPVLVASTAHWAKFGDNVYRALHGIAPGEPLPAEVAALTGCQLNGLDRAQRPATNNIPARPGWRSTQLPASASKSVIDARHPGHRGGSGALLEQA